MNRASYLSIRDSSKLRISREPLKCAGGFGEAETGQRLLPARLGAYLGKLGNRKT